MRKMFEAMTYGMSRRDAENYVMEILTRQHLDETGELPSESLMHFWEKSEAVKMAILSLCAASAMPEGKIGEVS